MIETLYMCESLVLTLYRCVYPDAQRCSNHPTRIQLDAQHWTRDEYTPDLFVCYTQEPQKGRHYEFIPITRAHWETTLAQHTQCSHPECVIRREEINLSSLSIP